MDCSLNRSAMRLSPLKHLQSYLMPGALLVVAAVGFLRPTGLPAWIHPLVSVLLPYLVLGFGLMLAWLQNNARTALALMILAVADRAIALATNGSIEVPGAGSVMLSYLALLLPLNLLALSLVGERPVFSRWTLIAMVLLAAQALLIAWLCHPARGGLAFALMSTPGDSQWTAWTSVPQPALLAFALAWTLHTLRFATTQHPLESASAWGMVTAFVAFHGGSFGWNPTNFLSATGLIIMVGLVCAAYRSDRYDEQTGVAGREAFDQLAARLGRRYSIGIVEIDDLGSFSGRYGQTIVEQLMRLIAATLTPIPGSGKLFRYGPDVFAVVFSKGLAQEAIGHLDVVRKRIEKIQVAVVKGSFVRDLSHRSDRETGDGHWISVSIGVAERNAELATLEKVIRAAYKALYFAKQNGGNRVKRASEVPEVTCATISSQPSHSEPIHYGDSYKA
ncbi:MAG: diguanylate cyclase domain-containing protein [Nitrospiraceae bacterium]